MYELIFVLQFCQKVWLGLYDMRSISSVDARDEIKMREMMSQRYEKKRWYVQPTDAMYEEARKQNSSVPVVTSKSSGLARPAIASVQVQLESPYLHFSAALLFNSFQHYVWLIV